MSQEELGRRINDLELALEDALCGDEQGHYDPHRVELIEERLAALNARRRTLQQQAR